MALRGKKPKNADKRLKLFMYGDAGVGKTTAACQMPSPYIIDTERGTDNYADKINGVGGAVFRTTDIHEVIEEIRNLSILKHGFKTFVIDSISPLYFDLVEKKEEEVGNEWGKHYQEANKDMKRMINLLVRLDMNVIITAHAKPEYGDDMKKIGTTFDGWKRLPYIFDLVLLLTKNTPTKRFAKVEKTRIESFPDGETFEWCLSALAERYSVEELERSAEQIEIAESFQIETINKMSEVMAAGDEYVANCMKKIGIDDLTDLSVEQANKMMLDMKKKVSVAV